MNPPVRPEDLLRSDRRHVWHPYGPMPGRAEPLVVESAAGVRLRLAGGAGANSWRATTPSHIACMPPSGSHTDMAMNVSP